MSKLVHFSRTTTVYEEGSATLSPSLSVASLPSSSSPELPTPPPEEEDVDTPTVVYPVTPFLTHQQQLDPLSPDLAFSSKMMQVHYTLAFTPFNDPAISWDLSYPPPTPPPTIQDEHTILTQQTLAEPATSPPLTSLIVTHPNLKWCIEIIPKDPTPRAFVSVSDVFTALFKELRFPIQPLEYAELPEGEIRSAVDTAYFTRCGGIPDAQLRLLEHQKGIKRIDLLRGQTKFLGLSGTLTAPDIWELNVS